eukprot:scaffold52186_cov29-Tisochrysis_lutea.AAC.13
MPKRRIRLRIHARSQCPLRTKLKLLRLPPRADTMRRQVSVSTAPLAAAEVAGRATSQQRSAGAARSHAQSFAAIHVRRLERHEGRQRLQRPRKAADRGGERHQFGRQQTGTRGGSRLAGEGADSDWDRIAAIGTSPAYRRMLLARACGPLARMRTRPAREGGSALCPTVMRIGGQNEQVGSHGVKTEPMGLARPPQLKRPIGTRAKRRFAQTG